jgi:hypothetical protein
MIDSLKIEDQKSNKKTGRYRKAFKEGILNYSHS